MDTTNTDRIEKKTLLRAPRSRVWRALTNAEEFGRWFGVRLSGEFAPGARLKGAITHPGYEHMPFEITVERMEPERLVSWSGPLTIKPDEPPSAQPTTLVVFELEEVPGGTLLTVVESGFDQIPPSHRAEAYRGNEQGWAVQMEAIGRYLANTGVEPMPATVIPPVDTERLTLRGHRLEDFEESFALWSNPEVTRFIGGKPSTREECWSRLLRYVGHWDVMGFGYWVVREKATGRFIGEVGLADFRRDIQPSLEGAKEAGWALVPEAHGKGYATEAVSGMLAWAEGRFGPERVVCLIDPENAPSLRVANRCGFREFAHGTYKGAPTRLFERVPGAR